MSSSKRTRRRNERKSWFLTEPTIRQRDAILDSNMARPPRDRWTGDEERQRKQTVVDLFNYVRGHPSVEALAAHGSTLDRSMTDFVDDYIARYHNSNVNTSNIDLECDETKGRIAAEVSEFVTTYHSCLKSMQEICKVSDSIQGDTTIVKRFFTEAEGYTFYFTSNLLRGFGFDSESVNDVADLEKCLWDFHVKHCRATQSKKRPLATTLPEAAEEHRLGPQGGPDGLLPNGVNARSDDPVPELQAREDDDDDDDDCMSISSEDDDDRGPDNSPTSNTRRSSTRRSSTRRRAHQESQSSEDSGPSRRNRAPARRTTSSGRSTTSHHTPPSGRSTTSLGTISSGQSTSSDRRMETTSPFVHNDERSRRARARLQQEHAFIGDTEDDLELDASVTHSTRVHEIPSCGNNSRPVQVLKKVGNVLVQKGDIFPSLKHFRESINPGIKESTFRDWVKPFVVAAGQTPTVSMCGVYFRYYTTRHVNNENMEAASPFVHNDERSRRARARMQQAYACIGDTENDLELDASVTHPTTVDEIPERILANNINNSSRPVQVLKKVGNVLVQEGDVFPSLSKFRASIKPERINENTFKELLNCFVVEAGQTPTVSMCGVYYRYYITSDLCKKALQSRDSGPEIKIRSFIGKEQLGLTIDSSVPKPPSVGADFKQKLLYNHPDQVPLQMLAPSKDDPSILVLHRYLPGGTTYARECYSDPDHADNREARLKAEAIKRVVVGPRAIPKYSIDGYFFRRVADQQVVDEAKKLQSEAYHAIRAAVASRDNSRYTGCAIPIVQVTYDEEGNMEFGDEFVSISAYCRSVQKKGDDDYDSMLKDKLSAVVADYEEDPRAVGKSMLHGVFWRRTDAPHSYPQIGGTNPETADETPVVERYTSQVRSEVSNPAVVKLSTNDMPDESCGVTNPGGKFVWRLNKKLVDWRTGGYRWMFTLHAKDDSDLPPGWSKLSRVGDPDDEHGNAWAFAFHFLSQDGTRIHRLRANRIVYLPEIREHDPVNFTMRHMQVDHLSQICTDLAWPNTTFSRGLANVCRNYCEGSKYGKEDGSDEWVIVEPCIHGARHLLGTQGTPVPCQYTGPYALLYPAGAEEGSVPAVLRSWDTFKRKDKAFFDKLSATWPAGRNGVDMTNYPLRPPSLE